jgi:hypothetical protein
VQSARLVLLCAVLPCAALGLLPSCGTSDYGDQPVDGFIPPPAGKGDRIYEIADPKSPKKAPNKTTVSVTGAVVIAVDEFDETANGKSTGTIYVADLGSQFPYSGISLYNPSFVPGNLRVGPGDTLDLRGEFQENQDLPVKFAPKAFLPQLSGPIGTFRFDGNLPAPVDLDAEGRRGVREFLDYDSGRKWLNMLVRVKNVTLYRGTDGESKSGRISSGLLPDSEGNAAKNCDDPFPKVPTLVNELMALPPIPQDTVIKELVGVVTYFCNFHIAPRTPADIKL